MGGNFKKNSVVTVSQSAKRSKIGSAKRPKPQKAAMGYACSWTHKNKNHSRLQTASAMKNLRVDMSSPKPVETCSRPAALAKGPASEDEKYLLGLLNAENYQLKKVKLAGAIPVRFQAGSQRHYISSTAVIYKKRDGTLCVRVLAGDYKESVFTFRGIWNLSKPKKTE